MENFEIVVKGIKCDNEVCDFIDMDARYEDYDDWLNRPCPKCGENLLTDRDHEAVKRMKGIAKALSLFPSSNSPEDRIEIPLEMNGSGEVKRGA